MAHLHMKIMKGKQRKFLYQNHINGVIIVDVYVVKYVHGLKEHHFLNIHFLMVEEAVQDIKDVLEKLIGIVLILPKLRKLKLLEYMKLKKNYLKKVKKHYLQVKQL